MRYVPLLSSLVAAIAASVVAAGPATPPGLEVIFYGTFDLGRVEFTDVPLGTRRRLMTLLFSANVTDPSGKLVATYLPTVETGLISNSGIYYPDVTAALRWEADGKLAYLQVPGVGTFSGGVRTLAYVHLETDSTVWSSLNERFLVIQVEGFGDRPTTLNFTFFGAIPSW